MTNIERQTPETGRLQLALNVEDLEASTKFYSDLFGTEPVKRKDGYVNFAIAEPPLKLILFQGASGGTINHLGVEVADTVDVSTATERLRSAEMPVDVEDNVTCCYSTQDKVWVTGPDGEKWEYYTVLADADRLVSDSQSCGCENQASSTTTGCCTAVA
jgi:catechol 2,3-dioxygenase-like lactoylglutathione lyase family enzyme